MTPSRPESATDILKCNQCGGDVTRAMAYLVRIELVNAGRAAGRKDVEKQAPFHAACAAWLFRAFEGAEPQLSDLEKRAFANG